MTGFEETHGFPLERVQEQFPGKRVVTMLGSVDAHGMDASGSFVHAVTGFYCPVDGCEALHPELTLGKLVSMS